MKSHEINATCACCGALHELASNVQGDADKPHAGSISLCIECGEFNVFDAKLRLRKPTPAEAAAFARDDDCQRLKAVWRFTVKPAMRRH